MSRPVAVSAGLNCLSGTRGASRIQPIVAEMSDQGPRLSLYVRVSNNRRPLYNFPPPNIPRRLPSLEPSADGDFPDGKPQLFRAARDRGARADVRGEPPGGASGLERETRQSRTAKGKEAAELICRRHVAENRVSRAGRQRGIGASDR